MQTHAYDTAGRRCIVCDGKGPKWPVEADEAWDLDDRTGTQTLKGVIALCPDCHLVRHWGQATISDRAEVALSQMMRVNRWSRAQAEAAGRDGMDLWRTRSRRHWTIDYSWVTRTHSIQIAVGGLDQAEAVNRDLVAQAEARAAGADGMPSWLRHLVG